MKLTLDREDMRPEFTHMGCSQTNFIHFNDETRQAIRAVGKATFYEYDRSNYNVIYAPRYVGREEPERREQ